jgi:hypothetical protein
MGPGIDNEDLNWSEPLECKIEKKFGDKYYFDIIITYPGGGIINTLFYSNKESKTLIFIHFLEIPNDIDIGIIERIDPHIIFYISNENALDRFYKNRYKNKILAAFPMYHSENVAKKYYNEIKTIDLLVVGNCNKNIYPLRDKFVSLVTNPKLSKYNVYVKPTESFTNYSVTDVINLKDSEHSIYNKSWDQTERYLKLINSSKLTVCTSSIRDKKLIGIEFSNFRLRKYSEIGLSSSLRIGEIPNEDYFNLSESVVDISDLDEESIVDKIIYYIENDNEREKLIKKQNDSEIDFTCCKYIEKVLYCHSMFFKNKFGMYSFCNFSLEYTEK